MRDWRDYDERHPVTGTAEDVCALYRGMAKAIRNLVAEVVAEGTELRLPESAWEVRP